LKSIWLQSSIMNIAANFFFFEAAAAVGDLARLWPPATLFRK
jgi:hypothetical protein